MQSPTAADSSNPLVLQHWEHLLFELEYTKTKLRVCTDSLSRSQGIIHTERLATYMKIEGLKQYVTESDRIIKDIDESLGTSQTFNLRLSEAYEAERRKVITLQTAERLSRMDFLVQYTDLELERKEHLATKGDRDAIELQLSQECVQHDRTKVEYERLLIEHEETKAELQATTRNVEDSYNSTDHLRTHLADTEKHLESVHKQLTEQEQVFHTKIDRQMEQNLGMRREIQILQAQLGLSGLVSTREVASTREKGRPPKSRKRTRVSSEGDA